MPGRVLIVAPEIAPESLPWRSIAEAARAEGLEAEWLAPVASENTLRARLAAADVRLVVLIGRGQSRGADHATIDLASSAGPEPRAVNVRHLAGLLAGAPGLEGIVLVGRDADAARPALAGFAARLVAHGAPAAMRWADAADVARVRTWFAAWRDGHDWPSLAQLGGALLEHAGQLSSAAQSSAAATSPQRRDRPRSLACRRPPRPRRPRHAPLLLRRRRHRPRPWSSACSRASEPKAASTSSSATTAPTSRP
jgi:hypothetical protein